MPPAAAHERMAKALERIADAVEQLLAARADEAAFARLLMKGVPADEATTAGFADYRDTPAGWEVLVPGEGWRAATLTDEMEIAAMTQKRRRR